jgi:hypothetical protein
MIGLLDQAANTARQFADALDDTLNKALCCFDQNPKYYGYEVPSFETPTGLSEGDPVHVWSRTKQRWIENGAVKEVANQDMRIGGAPIPAGSVKVVFTGDVPSQQGQKWVMPPEIRETIRKVPRPRPGHMPQTTPTRPVVATPSLDEMLGELRAIERRGQWSGEVFTDPEFSPIIGRVYDGGKHVVSAWNRVREITAHDGRPLQDDGSWAAMFGQFGATPHADWRLIRDKPRADDVQQGELGNCWFLSSLAALAEFQDGRFVRALFPGQSGISSSGVYLVRLCLGGQWRGILVDDRLPCIGGGMYCKQLACCVTHRLQIWASIIEKAYAKACGSYDAIVGGEAGEAFSALTGWPYTMIRFNQPGFDPDIFWAALCSSRDMGFLMTCSTCETSNSCLEPFHVSLLMDVFEEEVPGKGFVQLLKIRNQQETDKRKWQGEWSDRCRNWTPELRRKLGCPEGGSPGIWFINLKDFLKLFAHCTICRIRSDEWHESRQSVQLPSNDVAHTGLEITAHDTTECALSLSQPDERLRKGPMFRHLTPSEPCIGFVLVAAGSGGASGKGGGAELEEVAHAPMCSRATVSTDCWLQPKVPHVLVPLCLQPGSPMVGTWSCFSSKPVAVRETRLDGDTIRAAWGAYAKASCEKREEFRGATLYLGKAEGGAVVAYAENLSEGDFYVEVSFRSSELDFSRGKATSCDWLAPGQGQVLQVAQPKGSNGASYRWQHRFQMTSRSVGKLAHTPPVGTNSPSDLHAPFRLAGPSGQNVAAAKQTL